MGIIPEKPDLFGQKIVGRQARQIKKPTQSIKQEKEEEKPIFNIPQPPQSLPVMQIRMPSLPIKKSGWRKWVVIGAIALLIIGLGIYFLAG